MMYSLDNDYGAWQDEQHILWDTGHAWEQAAYIIDRDRRRALYDKMMAQRAILWRPPPAIRPARRPLILLIVKRQDTKETT